ncbi:MAG TPA: alpha/beta fold hydrolase [Euzebyales bacterium]|nr:alpha/beta fold hydrolase [Euzebyales bacterium]
MTPTDGSRRATFVLVPGAGGQAWYWHRVVEELRRRGQLATAVNLPAGDDAAGLATYVDVVVAAIGDTRPLVVVGQSMGGLTAPLVCERVSVDLLVLVNAMIPTPGETGGQWWDTTDQAAARAERAARDGRRLADDLLDDFFHDVPQHVVDEAMRRGEPPQSSTPFTDSWPLGGWPTVPTRVIAGRDDRFFPADFQIRIARQRLGITPVGVPGGHLIALSRPVELTDALVASWDDVGAGRTAADQAEVSLNRK